MLAGDARGEHTPLDLAALPARFAAWFERAAGRRAGHQLEMVGQGARGAGARC